MIIMMRASSALRLMLVAACCCCCMLSSRPGGGGVDGKVISLWGTDVEVAADDDAQGSSRGIPPPSASSAATDKPSKPKVLVIVYGEVRGGEVARESLVQKVLKQYDADLAMLGPPPPTPPPPDSSSAPDNSTRRTRTGAGRGGGGGAGGSMSKVRARKLKSLRLLDRSKPTQPSWLEKGKNAQHHHTSCVGSKQLNK